MEIFLLVVGVGVVAWWMSTRRKAEALQGKDALENFRFVHESKIIVTIYTVNFPTMKGQSLTYPTNGDPRLPSDRSNLVFRRQGEGWEYKSPERDTRWWPVPEELAPPLETAYQRYIRNA